MIRLLSAILMSLALGLASVSMAVARAESQGVIVLTICSDEGTETVTLDAAGNPVSSSHHHCPDCLVGLTLGDLPSAPLGNRPGTRTERLHLPESAQAALVLTQTPQARGPPSLI
ncbi:DUF2946 family protein [Thioclava sp. FR2]|uniref:DUF2946 family protein n=1 Tax=Thioclava sp. FR2 TaxID=3445780 RepID=UPI003EBF97A0